MRILVLQLKRIGDTILTTPLLATLRERFPECTITLALDEASSGLAPALDADRTLIFRRGRPNLSFWLAVSRGGFDASFDLTGNDRSTLATFLSRATRRITWQRFNRRFLRRAIFTDFVESSVKNRHTADHHTDLLRAFGIEVEHVPASLHLPPTAHAEAAEALTRIGISAPFAVVHAGTARVEKYWEASRWSEVIEFLQRELCLPVVLTGSSDAAEQAHLAAIQKSLPSPCPSLAGGLSLLGTAAVIEEAKMLCAVDSAPVHLADALGTPLVALFGPTNPFHWRPRRTDSRLVTAIAAKITPDFPKAPMTEIPVKKVIAAIRSLP